jgi:predicted DNA-binding transcriptional regulator YafY
LGLAFSEDLLRVLEGTVFHDSVQSALRKIRAGLGPELRAYLGSLTEAFRVLPGPHKRYAQSAETIQALSDAVIGHTTLTIRYRSGRSGSEAVRDLDPYRVWYRSGGLYVIGRDHRSNEIRTFAVDRILAIEPTSKSFEVPEDFDFDSYVASSFGVIAEPPSRICIRFTPSWRNHVTEHSWHPSQTIAELEDGGVELSMEVGGSVELRNWVLSFGAGAEVLEPASLRAAVQQELVAAARLYG